jgi:hypothetical protein
MARTPQTVERQFGVDELDRSPLDSKRPCVED